MPLLKKRKKTTQTPTPTNIKVPAGLVAHTEKGYYLVKGDKRFAFVSDRARETWGIHVVYSTEAAMASIPVRGMVGFRDGTVIRDIGNSKIYLISDYKKLHITNPDVLRDLGITEILDVSTKEAGMHKDGAILN